MRTLLDMMVTWPMPAVWLLLVGVVMLRHRTGKSLVVLAALLFLIGSLPITGKMLSSPLTKGAPPYVSGSDTSDLTAIVVIAAGAFVDSDGRWWPEEGSILRSVRGR